MNVLRKTQRSSLPEPQANRHLAKDASSSLYPENGTSIRQMEEIQSIVDNSPRVAEMNVIQSMTENQPTQMMHDSQVADADEVVQMIRQAGVYKLKKASNLRSHDNPYAPIRQLTQGEEVRIGRNPEEKRFDLGFFSVKKDHTWVTALNDTKEGWVTDKTLMRDEIRSSQDYFGQQQENARQEGRAAFKKQDEKAKAMAIGEIKMSQTLEKNVTPLIPDNVGTGNLYNFVVALNDNLQSGDFKYSGVHLHYEKVLTKETGDCRSICETLQFIAGTVLDAPGVTIECTPKLVRAAGTERVFSNHHWLLINGSRYDAMERKDFQYDAWEVSDDKGHTWRAMQPGDTKAGTC